MHPIILKWYFALAKRTHMLLQMLLYLNVLEELYKQFSSLILLVFVQIMGNLAEH